MLYIILLEVKLQSEWKPQVILYHQSQQDQKMGQTLHFPLEALQDNYKSLSYILISSLIAKFEQHHRLSPGKRFYPQTQKIIINQYQ